jgi:N-sulfoglucosamine sulfohydrolase
MRALIAMLCLGRVLLCGSSLATDTPPSRPNILFILTEDQGAHLSAIGTEGLQTPHMDSLARSGVYFRNAFVAYPVCSASKAAIYTGLHNHTNGILNNTVNYPKPASRLTQEERDRPLYLRNRIRADIPTLVERLRDAGYYQGATQKLQVAPVEKFPYDEFIPQNGRDVVAGFIGTATRKGTPWYVLCNIRNSHRPFPDSDKARIRVSPSEVKLPAFLPDTPVIRKDWAEYYAAVEDADRYVGEALDALRESGQESNTIVVFLSDHGPAIQRGKMTLYDLGLRVPMVIRVPWLTGGRTSDELVSELDIAPTLLDLLDLEPLPQTHGRSLRPVLEGTPEPKGREFIFAEISHKGPLPNDGLQERAVLDRRWKLIYREKYDPPWRLVQADAKNRMRWNNRVYDETLRVKDAFPVPYRILTEFDPQQLGGTLRPVELYDLQTDPDELRDVAGEAKWRHELERLYAALQRWARETADPSLSMPKQLPK